MAPWLVRTTRFPDAQQFPIVPSGRITLLGDAAHVMPPDKALGGSNVLEDARLLCELLTSSPRPIKLIAKKRSMPFVVLRSLFYKRSMNEVGPSSKTSIYCIHFILSSCRSRSAGRSSCTRRTGRTSNSSGASRSSCTGFSCCTCRASCSGRTCCAN